MSDLFKKLNTLIKAGMHDVLDEAQKAASAPGKFIPRRQLGADIDNEVEQLRNQINKALDYEDELNQKIADIQTEIDSLDKQSDDALANDDEINARYYLERMYRAEQRKTMMESDLKEHRIMTQELMQRVNELDATIAEAHHREEAAIKQDQVDETPPETTAKSGVEVAQELSQQASKALSDVLREARERVEQMSDLTEAQAEVQEQVTNTVEEQVQQETQRTKIEEDIAARRSRLSAPPKKPTDGRTT